MTRQTFARAVAAIGAGLLAFVVVGGVAGAFLGIPVAVGGAVWLARASANDDSAVKRQIAGELPFCLDLVAAALRAGASPEVAARSVGSAVGGPLGDRLGQVDQALRMGARADEAWSYLGTTVAAGAIAQAAVRSQHSGAAFATSLQRLADDLRADRLIAADAAARRAGVLIVLPLGLCFLPAFVLAGLVPVIVAVLGDVLSP